MKFGSVKMSIIKCLVLGIAGVGKTHLKWLLLSKNTDGTVERVNTGLADNPIKAYVGSIKSIYAGVNISGTWEVLDETELRHILARVCEIKNPEVDPIKAAATLSVPQSVHHTVSLQPVDAHQEHIDITAQIKTVTEGEILDENVLTSTSSVIAYYFVVLSENKPHSNPGPEKRNSLFIDAFKNARNKVKLDIEVQLVHFMDSGGQPQYLELLPAGCVCDSICCKPFRTLGPLSRNQTVWP